MATQLLKQISRNTGVLHVNTRHYSTCRAGGRSPGACISYLPPPPHCLFHMANRKPQDQPSTDASPLLTTHTAWKMPQLSRQGSSTNFRDPKTPPGNTTGLLEFACLSSAQVDPALQHFDAHTTRQPDSKGGRGAQQHKIRAPPTRPLFEGSIWM